MCAGGKRKRRAAPRQRRQAATQEGEDYEDVEAEFNPENPYHVSHTNNNSHVALCLHPAFEAVRSDLRVRGGLPEKAFPEECFSQLQERQQMLGSRRRGLDCHSTSENMHFSGWGCLKLSFQE